MTCNWNNTWTDSGDRGAAQHDHDQHYHPDHDHVWGPSTYEWEQAGRSYIVPLSGGVRGIRPETVTRCVSCGIAKDMDKTGKCR